MTLQLLAGPLGFALVLGLIAVGTPIGVSMAIVGTLGSIWLGGWDQAAYILSNLPFESISGTGCAAGALSRPFSRHGPSIFD